LQWAGHAVGMEEHCMPKKALQQIIHSKKKVGKDGKME